MAHGREIKKIEKELYLAIQDLEDENNLKEKKIPFKDKFFNELNSKTGIISEKNVLGDETINFEKNGIYVFNVVENSNLVFNFSDEKLIIGVIIKVIGNKTLNILENSSNDNLIKKCEVKLGEKSKLNFSQITMGSKYNLNTINLLRDSKYNLFQGYNIKSSNTYLKNNAFCNEENVSVNMKIKGFASKGAKVVCDGLINISENGTNCEGYQKIEGLILDDTSKIFTEPVLEVNNNNVRCSHGSSVSQISKEISFYMRSRSIGYNEMINLLMEGLILECVAILDQDSPIFDKLANQ